MGLTYYTTGKEIFVNNFSFLKLWQLLTGANLMFLLLDVCLPAWDFTNDLMITTKYWMNASFDWVKSFDRIISWWNEILSKDVYLLNLNLNKKTLYICKYLKLQYWNIFFVLEWICRVYSADRKQSNYIFFIFQLNLKLSLAWNLTKNT